MTRQPKQNTDQPQVELRGILVPAEWDQEGRVTKLAIASFDEREVLVDPQGVCLPLLPWVTRQIAVTGYLSTEPEGKEIIKVVKFRKLEGNKMSDLGKSLIALVVAGFFGVAMTAPVFAADKAAAPEQAKPAAKEMKAAPAVKAAPAAKAEAPKAAKAKPAKKAVKAKKAAPKADPQIKAAQEALIKAGYKVSADGMMGKKTKKAIKGFQKKNKLKVSGKLDEATLKALGL